ncbi:MAG TPA: hypothetical protein PKW33_11965 [Anaerolineaceae bacterium]|nr:hypothetical protein [Anaerolineaceae bacterium]HPN52296.1 hypothetical protein [Anaerolineaceae bacterium]
MLILISGLILSGATVSKAAPNACQGNSIRIPYDCNNIQDAINGVYNGGTLELFSGTYTAPGPSGWAVNDQFKTIHFKAMPGQTVVFSGENSRPILRFQNSNFDPNIRLTFSGITFRNGYSTVGGLAGGVSVYKGIAEFTNCTFENNGSQNSGGGMMITQNALVYVNGSTFTGNSSPVSGGAIAINENSEVYVSGSTFTGNRVNLPGHQTTSAGGAIHAGNSDLYINNSTFTSNQAGYVGGAVYSIADWYQAREVIIRSSTFTDNKAWPDPSVTIDFPTEGGAFHTESNVTGQVYYSSFIKNTAMVGGAMTMYRSVVNVYDSIFRGNTSPGSSRFQGCGGAISGGSNDTPVDGGNNYRNVSLSVYDSLFQGHYGTITGALSNCGSAIYLAGDANRLYGQNGTGQMGNAATNRAHLTVDGCAFYDFQTSEMNNHSSTGGIIMGDLANMTLTDNLLLKGYAGGVNLAYGGALAVINQSAANVSDVVFAQNTSDYYGGAVFGHGSNLNITSSIFSDNVMTRGNAANNSYGADIFTTIIQSPAVNMTGTISNSVISKSSGLPIFDDDRDDLLAPINDMHYNNLQIQGNSNSISPAVYTDSVFGYSGKTVSELNTLIVTRSKAGVSTDKALVNNTELSAPYEYVALKVFWPQLDPLAGRTTAFLVYAWGGSSATLNGSNLSNKTGLIEITSPGTYTLKAGNKQTSVVVTRLNPAVFLPMVLH